MNGWKKITLDRTNGSSPPMELEKFGSPLFVAVLPAQRTASTHFVAEWLHTCERMRRRATKANFPSVNTNECIRFVECTRNAHIHSQPQSKCTTFFNSVSILYRALSLNHSHLFIHLTAEFLPTQNQSRYRAYTTLHTSGAHTITWARLPYSSANTDQHLAARTRMYSRNTLVVTNGLGRLVFYARRT